MPLACDPGGGDRDGTASSFRDPSGRLFRYGPRILRAVSRQALPDLHAFRTSLAGRRAIDAGDVLNGVFLSEGEAGALAGDPAVAPFLEGIDVGAIVEHPLVPFRSFPYEWPAEMLHAAAVLTLRLAAETLDDGFGLKDATPYNVLFRGPRPVFVDLLSFERRAPDDPIWLAYAQFIRTFLLPLLAWRRLRLPPASVFLPRRDGLEPDELRRWLGFFDRWRPPALSLVTLPALLASRSSDATYRPRSSGSPEKASFVLQHLFHGLSRHLERVRPDALSSRWADYLETQQHYSDAQFQAKEEFVRRAIGETQPRDVLDVGANTGHFSLIAARLGASVVAIDSDPVAAGIAWRRAHAERLDILPLALDFARPTPPTGWLNAECPGFLERARTRFDLVMMLAVIHHLIVTERVPLPEILSLAASLTRKWLLIEYVDRTDPMFIRIARGRDSLHQGFCRQAFESVCQRSFEIVRSDQSEGSHRRIYLLRKLGS